MPTHEEPTNEELTDELIRKAFDLARCLQPAREVAVRVLIDACIKVPALRNLQAKLPGASNPFKLRMSGENLLQRSVYLASERWEKDQESAHPMKSPAYRPTADDMLVRYIAALVFITMRRMSHYAAVAVGCHLYTYQPQNIIDLAADLFNSNNIRRCKGRVYKRLKKRFPGLLSDGGGRVLLEPPDEHERALVHESLSALAPWCACPTAASPDAPLIVTCFGYDSTSSELERMHALFNSECCGLARLVREYNAYDQMNGSDKMLDDPKKMLGVPKFDDFREPDGGGGGEPPDWRARFNSEPLTEAELSSIRHAVELNQRRRSQYRGGEFRVYVDGVDEGVFTRDYLFDAFDLPDTASCIEVFGEDENEEEVLLAVFPLHLLEPDDEALGQSLCVTLAGGQSIELSVAPVPEQGREPSEESVVRLKYANSPEQADEPRPHVGERHAGFEPVAVGDGPYHDFWGGVFEQFYPRLKAYALAIARGRTFDAEDLVQETCYRALRYAKDPEKVGNPFAYLWTVMRNVRVDKGIRQSAKFESLDELLDSGRHPSVEPQALRLLENREFDAGLVARRGHLSQREKLLLKLHLGGYKAKDIADALKEDVQRTRYDLNAVKAKVRYRLAAAKREKRPGY